MRQPIFYKNINKRNSFFYVNKSGLTRFQKALQMTLEESRRGSPLYHLPKHSIPAIIAHGEKEPFILYHLEANNYAQELQKVDCKVALIEVPNANHFDMINELANTEGKVFQAVIKMLS